MKLIHIHMYNIRMHVHMCLAVSYLLSPVSAKNTYYMWCVVGLCVLGEVSFYCFWLVYYFPCIYIYIIYTCVCFALLLHSDYTNTHTYICIICVCITHAYIYMHVACSVILLSL